MALVSKPVTTYKPFPKEKGVTKRSFPPLVFNPPSTPAVRRQIPPWLIAIERTVVLFLLLIFAVPLLMSGWDRFEKGHELRSQEAARKDLTFKPLKFTKNELALYLNVESRFKRRVKIVDNSNRIQQLDPARLSAIASDFRQYFTEQPPENMDQCLSRLCLKLLKEPYFHQNPPDATLAAFLGLMTANQEYGFKLTLFGRRDWALHFIYGAYFGTGYDQYYYGELMAHIKEVEDSFDEHNYYDMGDAAMTMLGARWGANVSENPAKAAEWINLWASGMKISSLPPPSGDITRVIIQDSPSVEQFRNVQLYALQTLQLTGFISDKPAQNLPYMTGIRYNQENKVTITETPPEPVVIQSAH